MSDWVDWSSDTIRIIVDGHLKSSQAKAWCHENIGKDWWKDEEDGLWSWTVGKDLTTEFQFRNKQDAVLFALRWL
jgi:hypothetical protein